MSPCIVLMLPTTGAREDASIPLETLTEKLHLARGTRPLFVSIKLEELRHSGRECCDIFNELDTGVAVANRQPNRLRKSAIFAISAELSRNTKMADRIAGKCLLDGWREDG